MRAWHIVLTALLLTALLRGAIDGPRVLTAAEVDTLEAGVDLALALTDDAPSSWSERLRTGFEARSENPRVAALSKHDIDRRQIVQPPLPQWVAAVAIMLSPSESVSNPDRTRTLAALLVALAIAWLVWIRRGVGLVQAALGGALVLLLPGVVDAGLGSGYAASGLLVGTAMVAATQRMLDGGAAWPVGLAWGLCLGVHPGAILLIIPAFVAYALARPTRSASTSAPNGELTLPTIPLGLLLSPVLGLVLLVGLWPSLWSRTATRLVGWFADAGGTQLPIHTVAGQVYDQSGGEAPPAWAALLEWADAVSWPLAAAAIIGVICLAQTGRRARWFPALMLVSLFLSGAMDGGLYGARLELLPLMWAPTALLGATGIVAGARWTGDRLAVPERRRSVILIASILVVVAWPAVLALAPGTQRERTGASLRRPVSVTMLERLSHQGPVWVHVVPVSSEWGPACIAARDHLNLPIRWSETPRSAGRVLVAHRAEIVALTPEMPASSGYADGVWFSDRPTVGTKRR
ncbi:MAG: hypothetical protein ACI9MR_001686 [Myxococcota bacterium]